MVLAGDAGGTYSLPTWYETVSGYDGEGDHPYTQLAGGDVLSDAHVGRLSFGTLTELETIVAKTVGYESTPYLADTAWYTRACLVGDPERLRLQHRPGPAVDQDPPAAAGVHADRHHLRRQLRQSDVHRPEPGRHHLLLPRLLPGMSGWGNSNTNALTNGWKMPFACISTCGTGSFAGGTARSEQFLRAGSPTTPKAAIGAIGTATTGTHTRFNNCYTFGVFWGMLYNECSRDGRGPHLGQAQPLPQLPGHPAELGHHLLLLEQPHGRPGLRHLDGRAGPGGRHFTPQPCRWARTHLPSR